MMKHRIKRYLLLAFVPLLVWFYFCLPDPLFNVPYSTVLNSEDGTLLGATTANDQQWRFPKPDSVPYKFEQAIINFEDAHFYSHPGVNPVSLMKAFYQNIQAGEVVRGGSTLSMQVIRLSRMGQPRTYLEKLYECFLALRLELRFAKAEILQLYAGHAPFGGNVVGLDAASWRYYSRPPHKLSWGEATALAVLPNAPSLIFPGKNEGALKNKRDRLIDKLAENDVIDSLSAVLAKEEPLPSKPLALPEIAPHALAHYKVKKPKGDLIKSTLNQELQKTTTAIVQNYYKYLSQNQIYNAAALVVDTKTGEVKAYVGNTEDPQNQNENAVDVVRSPRSSGSTLKPFLYANMQQKGQLLPKTLLADVPTYISGYAPKNFDEKFDGAVHADNALARSLNVPAVRMLQDYGVEIFHHDLQSMGFSTINRSAGNYGLSLILGGAEVTLWDLVRNYRKMALSILQFHEPQDEINDLYLADKEQALINKLPVNAGASWLTMQALKTMDRPIEGTDWNLYQSAKNIAWKTGTSFGHKDAWAIGVTPDYVVGVWVGNADGEGRPGLTGASTAAPIMFDVFKQLPGNSWFEQPEAEMRTVEVCTASGYKASEFCTVTDAIFVTANGLKTSLCPFHERVHLDKSAQFRVNADCYKVADMVTKPWFVLPPVMEWYYKSNNPYYKKLPPFMASCVPGTSNLDLIYPQPHAQLFIPKGFDGQKEKLVFEATHRLSNTTLYWHIDNKYLQSTFNQHQIELQPEPGEHLLTVVSEDGESISRKFEVVNN